MKEKLEKIEYAAAVAVFGLLAVLFVGVMFTSLGKNLIDMCVRVGWDWGHTGNYVGLFAGFAAYGVFMLFLMMRTTTLSRSPILMPVPSSLSSVTWQAGVWAPPVPALLNSMLANTLLPNAGTAIIL